MGIGKDLALSLLAQTSNRGELADAASVLNDALLAIDTANAAAEQSFMTARASELAASQAAAREAAVLEVVTRHTPKGKK